MILWILSFAKITQISKFCYSLPTFYSMCPPYDASPFKEYVQYFPRRFIYIPRAVGTEPPKN